MSAIRLSDRLMMVYRLLDMGNVYADVGCDHGYLPIRLIEDGKFKNAIAMDINEGPLSKAADNINAHGLSLDIETRLSDGVKALSIGEADAISICGMGGNVMMHIFEEGQEVLRGLDTIVIQPQSEYSKLREYLRLKEYTIVDEDIVVEDGHYYFAWKLSATGGRVPCRAFLSGSDLDEQIRDKEPVPLSHLDEKIRDKEPVPLSHLSPILLERKNPIYKDYLMQQMLSIDKAIANIESNGNKQSARYEELISERKLIDENIRMYYNNE